MKKIENAEDDTLRPEYDRASLGEGVRGKYLKRFRSGTNLVLLAPEVAALFPDDQAVNAALLSLAKSEGSASRASGAPGQLGERLNVPSKYRSRPSYHLVYSRLIEAARHRGTVTYQEIAKIVGLPLSGNHMQGEIGHLLGEISEDEHLYGRPLLSAVAVNSKGNPGAGFFELARLLGELASKDPADESRFWADQKAEIYAVWAEDLDSYVPSKKQQRGGR
jgi:hypothetical protein